MVAIKKIKIALVMFKTETIILGNLFQISFITDY